ncbi:hypothetical protein [Pelagibacterium sp. H642]|uniref:hypothetical protein n=1 Tax=Pelagibacterium sp. H642 TaxID=1881069 RepID=UPI0028162E43|nr:hypothetical protein [Pelagibacterium sp. H642]WMT92815.1 hypothetical protein NO934_18715 [Pelagibacterium sp. H642]
MVNEGSIELMPVESFPELVEQFNQSKVLRLALLRRGVNIKALYVSGQLMRVPA